jgi:hypothetical protein
MQKIVNLLTNFCRQLFLVVLLFFSFPLQAHMTSNKTRNSILLLKGTAKVIISTIIGVQAGRFIKNNKTDREVISTLALLSIPTLHFFLSGCEDIITTVKNWKKVKIN